MSIAENVQLAAADGAVVANGLISKVNDLTSQTTTTVKAVLILAGLIIALMIILKNPTIGRVISGVCVGAFVAGLPWIIPAVGELFRGDIDSSGVGVTFDYVVQAFSTNHDTTSLKG